MSDLVERLRCPVCQSCKDLGYCVARMEAEKRITELEGELAKLSLPGGLTVNCLRLRTCSERAKLEGERDTATRALQELRAGLERFGVHRHGCVWKLGRDHGCTCGLNAALSKTEKKGDN